MEEDKLSDILDEKCFVNSDLDFCSFYYKAVKRLYDLDCQPNVSYLCRYAKIFNIYCDKFCELHFGPNSPDKCIKELLTDSFHFRLLYVYKNASLLSSAVASHFQNVLTKNPESIKRLLKKKIVRLCSIGGSSIPDIVAIISTLKLLALEEDVKFDFRVTILDYNTDWKSTCLTVLMCLEEFQDATWKIDFIESDLSAPQTWIEEVFKSIQEADIITMAQMTYNFHVKKGIVMILSPSAADALN